MPMRSLSQKETLKANLGKIERTITDFCKRAHRKREDVTLIAVSKGHDFSNILSLYELGQRDFGESYAQEMVPKIDLALEHKLSDIRWHFIGAIQTNKLQLIKRANVIHSVGSVRHAEMLDKILDEPMPIFLQINLDKNPKRQGFLESDLDQSIKKLSYLKKLKIQGLMCILPQDEDPDFWFKKMAALKQAVLNQGLISDVYLSMGMSDDFELAIQHGADYLRIGTKIFGARAD